MKSDGAEVNQTQVNPYVTVVAKKSRNLHKKLEKILKADAQQKSGKVLNEEQLVLLTTRSSVEKQLSDIDAIKALLEEVASQEKEQSSTPVEEQKEEVNENEEALKSMAADVASQQSEIEELKSKLAQEEVNRLNLERRISEMDVVNASLQVNTAALHTPDSQAIFQKKIHKLLKLFHVCARYPGAKLPADVNFFGKCLMGETSISGFKETLAECTRKAELYLDDKLSVDYEASRGMTYHDISVLMNELAAELGGPPTPPPPESSPMINFFTDNNDGDIDLNSDPLDLMVPLANASDNAELSNQIIGDHIDNIITEEKSSLQAEVTNDNKKKDNKKPKKTRSKKDVTNKETTSDSDKKPANVGETSGNGKPSNLQGSKNPRGNKSSGGKGGPGRGNAPVKSTGGGKGGRGGRGSGKGSSNAPNTKSD